MNVIEQILALESIRRTLMNEVVTIAFHPTMHYVVMKKLTTLCKKHGWTVLDSMVEYAGYCGYGVLLAKETDEITPWDRRLARKLWDRNL